MNQQSALLKEIQAEDFALYDTLLYLDTHPDCAEALQYFHEKCSELLLLRKEYESQWGPIHFYSQSSCRPWQWGQGPWPWEKEAN